VPARLVASIVVVRRSSGIVAGSWGKRRVFKHSHSTLEV
jgi:hypothetical protein